MKFSANKKAIEFATTAAVENRQRLKYYLRSRLTREEDLDDLAQEVYLRLLRMRDEAQVNRIRQPMAYVYRTAANVINDWYRASDPCTEDSLSLEDADREREMGPGSTTSSLVIDDDSADRVARQQCVERAFSQLPPIEQTVLLLQARDGLSYRKIAKKLRLSVHMVHYYLTRAKTRIRLLALER